MRAASLWILIGFAGQALFFSRFLVQWIVSELRGESVVPRAFWFLSIGGGALLLTYAIYRRDPVFIAGQSIGLFVYLRNLWWVSRRGGQPPMGLDGTATAGGAKP
ncbi:hypothetical protein ABI59_18000 [Acidobacteria bacterium Mor1]|nr:hypothetical protein ABI59_18000 [Acidobacteria bacterium Mor1]